MAADLCVCGHPYTSHVRWPTMGGDGTQPCGPCGGGCKDFSSAEESAPSDPADYGAAGPDDAADPHEVRCRSCGQVAIDHTPGAYSVYGVCPALNAPTGEADHG